jgi:hypothetical protein
MNKNKEAILNDFLGEDNYNADDYLVCKEIEAGKAVEEKIIEDLWTFRASFIRSHMSYKPEPREAGRVEKAIEEMQGKLCESAQPIIRSMIKNLDHFIADAISSDGRGHFLASYDGEEIEHDYNGETYYIYRLN